MNDKETAILIDHDAKTVMVDTNVRSVASILKVRGFIEKDDPRAKPYRRFVGEIDQIAFRKKDRRVTMARNNENSLKNLDKCREK